MAADKASHENGVEYIGRSGVVSPLGQVLAQAESLDDEVVVVTIDLDRIGDERGRRRYLAELRPDQYGAMTREATAAT